MSIKQRARRRVGSSRLEAMVEEATVDAYGESEQRGGFFCMLEEHLAMPFETELLGVQVLVERIVQGPDESITALCRNGRHRQSIPILDLPLPAPPPAGWEWIEAYRAWCQGRY